MKEGRQIIIRSKKLQKIRNNLRKIIISAYKEERRRLGKEEDLVYFWQDGVARTPTIQEKAQGVYYLEKRRELERALEKSICQCALCSHSNRDMIFDSTLGGWVCFKCKKIRSNSDLFL